MDQGPDDPVHFRLHHPERSFDLVEAELVRGHRRGVHLAGLHQPEDPTKPLAAPAVQPAVDLLVSHPHPERLQRDLEWLRDLAVIAEVGDKPPGIGDPNRRIPRFGGTQRLDGSVYPFAIGQLQDLLDRITFGVINYHVGAEATGEFLWRDLQKVPQKVREDLEFVFVERISEATRVALTYKRGTTRRPEIATVEAVRPQGADPPIGLR